jgi:hypothetical protein
MYMVNAGGKIRKNEHGNLEVEMICRLIFLFQHDGNEHSTWREREREREGKSAELQYGDRRL